MDLVSTEGIASPGRDVDVLLDAVLSVGRGLELETTLRRVVRAAADLVDARYAALGVLGDDGLISQFLTVGVTEEEIRSIGAYPRGHGLLGELIRHPEPLRIPDIGADHRAVGFPAHHPPMTSFVGVPLRVHGSPFGNLYLTDKRGAGDFTAADQRLLEGLASATSVAVENARLYEETRLRERWAHADDEISRRLLSGQAPDAVLGLVAEGATQVADADTAGIALPTEGTPGSPGSPGSPPSSLTVRAAVGLDAESLPGRVVPLARSFTAQAFLSGRPLVTHDATADDRGETALHPSGTIGPLAAIPLGGQGLPRGVLVVGRRRGAPPFGGLVVEALEAFANRAAVALELAERRGDAEWLAVVRDRDRIARDLHDLAVQRLYATGLGLQAVSRRLGRGDLDVTEAAAQGARVSEAVDQVDETISLIRTTIHGLRDTEEGSRRVGARARLVAEAETAARALGFPPGVRFDGPVDALVPPVMADHLVAVVRETLSNAARHARASRVDVVLRVGEDVVLTVVDDGEGLDLEAPRSGLANLARRAAELGGTLDVQRGRRRGTELRWQVPLPDDGF